MIRSVIMWIILSIVMIVSVVILTVGLINDHKAPTRTPTPWAVGTGR